ncbi:gamma-glutamyl-gamma-aminobutyrate hydrolase family protein [Curtobacterium sp. RRHDQ10]|uniref:gamma-glutamyl-gamma-aminobutyrate hydrolase family protein n=1 Tax=Curtobacterium phyllosphaerae TaxID=3413379 RepID=UPI003BF0E93E
MTALRRPLLAVVDVSDGGRHDPAFDAVLVALTARVLAAGERVGFAPVRLAAEQLGAEGLLAAVAGADAVVLTGGEDVAPERYNGALEYEGAGQLFRTADDAQIDLVRHVVAGRIPTVGICRGMQVVNVALGGDLVQHLADGGHVRGGAPTESMVDHPVRIDERSDLASVLGVTTLTVRSSHHQAVGRLGAGLSAVASAPDGTVEAVEHQDAPLWAVQWHPEDPGAAGDVLERLLAAARDAVPAAR